jgi:hypothetical protein
MWVTILALVVFFGGALALVAWLHGQSNGHMRDRINAELDRPPPYDWQDDDPA